MSVIIQAGSAITRSCVNTSSSKQMYSFSKAERFPKLKKCSSAGYYDIPSTITKRYTTFGFGNKSDFTIAAKGNNAVFHDNRSDFDPKNSHGPKFSFSNGREKYGKVYLDSVKMFDKDVPGPGKYYYLKPFGSDCPKYSMKGRNENPVTRKGEFVPSPAPNLYSNVYKMNVSGRYPMSNVRNVNSVRMNYDKTRRSDYVINKNPGPGAYEKKTLLGRIIDSKYTSYEARSILGRHKIIDSRSNYPGPGSYKLPSDFGQYQSKDADKYPQENVHVVEKPKFEEKAWRNGMKKIKKKEEKKKEDEYKEEENKEEGNKEEENKEEENKEEGNKEEGNKEEGNKEEENREEGNKEEENREEENKEEKKEEEKKEEGNKEEENREEEKKEEN